MVMLVFGPRGIPATLPHMQGFGVNTYKWVNEAGETVLVKYHWHPKQGVKSWTDGRRRRRAGRGARRPHEGPLRRDRRAATTPSGTSSSSSWSDDEHPELDFDPLDDTKTWPENDFPLRHVGRMQLNRAPENFFAESEQIAFGTGVLVDGLDFSDDKMLVGRTFSYSRHAALPRRHELPAAARQRAQEARRDQPARRRDDLLRRRDRREPVGQLRAVDHRRADARPPKPGAHRAGPADRGPPHARQASRARTTTSRPASASSSPSRGRRTTSSPTSPRLLAQCDRPIQERMVWHLYMVEDELGQRVGEGLGISLDDVKGARAARHPDAQRRGARAAREPRQQRPARRVGLEMTHCVPNEHVEVADQPVTA